MMLFIQKRGISMSIQDLDVSELQSKADWEQVKAADYVTYVICPGDTLNKIAERFGTTTDALREINHISGPVQLYAGNTIHIPEDGTT